MSWIISESDLPSDEPDFLSTIFTVGNGLICTRGTLGEQRHEAFRGNYISGLYTRAGYGLVYFLGAPDWLPAFVRIGGRAPDARQSHRELDMSNGVLTRTAEFVAGDRTVRMTERRFASLADPRLLCQRVELDVETGGDEVEVFLGVDGDVRNHPAKYYKPGDLPNVDEAGVKLAEMESVAADEDGFRVVLLSGQVRKRVAVAGVARQTGGEPVDRTDGEAGGLAGATFRIPAGQGGGFTFEKLCGWLADIEPGDISAGDCDALLAEVSGGSWAEALESHSDAWRRFWDLADVRIEGDEHAQRAVRFAVYSTRIAAADDDGASSVGAKNLTGDWYRGAVFWDMEMYQLPLLSAVAPRLARNHILYRRRRLDSARTLAAQDGYAGARFPWHSFQSGLEEPPAIGGLAYQQVHLNAAVPWGILHYHALTGDDATLLEAGLEVLIEQCRFWVSRVVFDDDGGYHLRGICGPDEVHRDIDDNAYTCGMVRALLRRTDELIDELSGRGPDRVGELLRDERLAFDHAERDLWRDVAENVHIPRLPGGAPAQFAGIGGYAEPSPAELRKGEGSDKTHKQADALMLFHALPRAFDDADVERAYREHSPLCNQTSSLSMATHAMLAARLGRARDARRYFDAATGVDLEDSFGNTRHGIHGAGEGGIWMAVVHGFGGLRVGERGVVVEPHLPPWWRELRYAFLLGGRRVDVRVEGGRVQVHNAADDGPVELTVRGEQVSLASGETRCFEYEPVWSEELEGVVIGPSVAAEDASGPAGECRTKGLAVGAFGDAAEALREQLDAFTPSEALTDPPPDAQGYYVTAQRLRRLPWNCVGICGTADEVAAAHSAGMAAVGLGPDAAGADVTVDGAGDITPEKLRDGFLRYECDTNPYHERNVRKMRMEMG